MGIGVLAAALLAAAILPRLDGRRIAGAAVRGPTPVVGDCLIVTGRLNQGYEGLPNAEYELPTGRLGSCIDGRSGQLFAVDHQHRPTGRTDPAAYAKLRAGVCGPGLVDFVHSIESKDQFIWQGNRAGTATEIGYRPQSGRIDAVIVGSPADVEQSWAACMMIAHTDRGTEPLSLISPRAANQLTTCRTGREFLPCDGPHTQESLGSWFMITGTPARADFEEACRAFAAHRLGTTALIASGQLRTELGDGAGDARDSDCTVSVVDRARTLTGSLVGIGDRPLPWTR